MKWKIADQLHIATAIAQEPKSQVVRDISLFRNGVSWKGNRESPQPGDNMRGIAGNGNGK